MKKAGKNIYICKNKREKNRIVEGRPWIYDKALLLFEKPKGNSGINALEFRYAQFWFHFHNLPAVCFSRKYATELGNAIGTFVKVDLNEKEQEWGETLRVKIRIDINKPLKRGTNLQIGSMAEDVWIPVSIEKLPDFCYHCGKVGHVVRECEEEDYEDLELEEYQYGPWMRRNHNF